MKKLLLLVSLSIFSFAQTDGFQIKSVEDTTSSNASKTVDIPEEKRPAGFIIYEAKEEKIAFNEAGKVLDKNGEIKLIRLHVNFDFDKYDLKNEYQDEIEEAVAFIKKNPTLSMSVDGHTDSVGTTAYNQSLSEKRAGTVKARLVLMGADAEKIETKGHGELEPIVANDTAENRAKNRRVDITFNK